MLEMTIAAADSQALSCESEAMFSAETIMRKQSYYLSAFLLGLKEVSQCLRNPSKPEMATWFTFSGRRELF
jgi:hypothetical protein